MSIKLDILVYTSSSYENFANVRLRESKDLNSVGFYVLMIFKQLDRWVAFYATSKHVLCHCRKRTWLKRRTCRVFNSEFSVTFIGERFQAVR